ncbi:hypothetical protein [Streptomyces sp. NPDC005732]|uniref:hypothetical protein n=1 Tax=Streptomyces sp. NPDC005732 TaxID=3157057 RepID=UPI0033E4556A
MVAVPDQPSQPGGQQVEKVEPVDDEALVREPAGQFGGGAVVAGADARRDDRDAFGPGGGRRRFAAEGVGRQGARMHRTSEVGHGVVPPGVERAAELYNM